MIDSSEEEKKRRIPSVKAFIAAESPITVIWETNEDVKAVYNMGLALAILFTLFSLTSYALDPSLIRTDILLVSWMLKNFHQVLFVWTLMNVSTLVMFYTSRHYNNSQSFSLKTVKTIYGLYFISFLLGPCYFLLYSDVSPILRVALSCEQVRLMMKVHAFVAETTWMTTKEKGIQVTLHQYGYFLFAPTLVFRTSYPRTASTNWFNVLSLALQFMTIAVVTFLSLPKFLKNNLSDYGTGKFTITSYLNVIFHGTIMGAQIMFFIFYSTLHCWMNIFSEILRFADRRFYDKWWLIGNYSDYYREWNMIVHDWLRSYVYREFLVNSKSKNKALAALTVFVISAVFHEYIWTLTFRFYYPVLMFLFLGLGTIVYFTSFYFRTFYRKFGNVFMFTSIFLGYSVQLVLYGSEHYARENCPQVGGFWSDILFPRSWTCF